MIFNVSKCDPDSVRAKYAYILADCLFQHFSVHGVGMYWYVDFTPAKYSALSSHLPSGHLCTDQIQTVVISDPVIGNSNS